MTLYVHCTSKAKVLARVTSDLLIHYLLTDGFRGRQRRNCVDISYSAARFLPAQPKGKISLRWFLPTSPQHFIRQLLLYMEIKCVCRNKTNVVDGNKSMRFKKLIRLYCTNGN